MYTKSSVSYYDGLGEDYDKFYAKHVKHAADVLPGIVEKLTNGTTQRILDIGAGTGAGSIPLAHYGHKVVSLDNCDRMISILQEKIIHLNLGNLISPIKGDILDVDALKSLSADDKTFNGIVFWGNGLCHISPKDYGVFVTNVKQLLKPNGWLLLDYRSGEQMRLRGSHVEILYESPTEIKLSCVHSVPDKGSGPIHRALVSIQIATSNGTERRMTKASFNSIWPYLVDDSQIRKVLIREGFVKVQDLDTEAPLSDMVTVVYRLGQNG